ncbi:XK-related protein 9 isoform X1 [Pseudophryne corroboree]|uniref:XK-related protein 9 isoform X1 n=1 Tax=Pseudophryne corroboree TaxID=495146 RepID=UPI003081E121
MSFTKWNFFMTMSGIFAFIFDIGADLWISLKYFQQELYLFGLLTIFFVLVSTLIVQAFSFTWFKDDSDESSYSRLKWILIIHLFQAGTLLRYWYAVKFGYQATHDPSREKRMDTKKKAVEAMTDLSMLRCFKTYLESAPQLILQLYILMEHGQITVIQYASILISVSSISWSTVDYQMSLRKSLPGKKGISVGFPMFSYVFYKLFTLTSWLLSIVFLLTCNVHIFTTLVIMLGIAGFCWASMQHTDFCQNTRMEILYRVVVGIILIFTFFNVKGSRTRIPISVYYCVRVLMTTGILTLCFYLKPAFIFTFIFAVLSIAVVAALGFGILFLIIYYAYFHPSLHFTDQTSEDTVDYPASMGKSRITNFMRP